MLKLEYQICSLEQAKKLDALGLYQKSIYYYNTFYNTSSGKIGDLCITINDDNKINLDDDGDEKPYIKNHRWYSAFTTSELLKINSETITLDSDVLNAPACFVAERLISRIENGDFSVSEFNSKHL